MQTHQYTQNPMVAHRRIVGWVLVVLCLSLVVVIFLANTRSDLPLSIRSIGTIQGNGQTSPLLGLYVEFQGVVTGVREDVNQLGIHYFTLFVQDLPGESDQDDSTSDGIGVFVGRDFPSAEVGDVVTIKGTVTEFYGFTEIDDKGLEIRIDAHNAQVPVPVPLNPPKDLAAAEKYFESLESMLVSLSVGYAVGPTHEGCGFAVVNNPPESLHIYKNHISDPTGEIVNVLHWTDSSCDELPEVMIGDRIQNIYGPLIFHFDRFKVVQQAHKTLYVERVSEQISCLLPNKREHQITVVTLNLNDYFDTVLDTGLSAEPVLSDEELVLKQTKLAYAIAENLKCPEVLAVQEVEKVDLLTSLSAMLTDHCGFNYEVSYEESPDVRGADLALMTEPNVVDIQQISLTQTCTKYITDVADLLAYCNPGDYPLFSRPPLRVDLQLDHEDVTILINHFKSKRGGEKETATWRFKQAQDLVKVINVIQEEGKSQIIVLGDFNDYSESLVMWVLTASTQLRDGLAKLQPDDRYSYIFDGEAQLIDWILLSPSLYDRVVTAGVCHVNADYPFQWGYSSDKSLVGFRSSDHDFPYVTIALSEFAKDQSIENQSLVQQIPMTVTSTFPQVTPTKVDSLAARSEQATAQMGRQEGSSRLQSTLKDQGQKTDNILSYLPLIIGFLLLTGCMIVLIVRTIVSGKS